MIIMIVIIINLYNSNSYVFCYRIFIELHIRFVFSSLIFIMALLFLVRPDADSVFRESGLCRAVRSGTDACSIIAFGNLCPGEFSSLVYSIINNTSTETVQKVWRMPVWIFLKINCLLLFHFILLILEFLNSRLND